jgi:hypothetical protein
MNKQLNIEQIERMVSNPQNEKSRMIWNAALEEAAKVCDKYESYGAAYEIRKVLKK